MEASENCSVKVAVHIRPLISDERLQGCKECVTVTPGKPQVLFTAFWVIIELGSWSCFVSIMGFVFLT